MKILSVSLKFFNSLKKSFTFLMFIIEIFSGCKVIRIFFLQNFKFIFFFQKIIIFFFNFDALYAPKAPELTI